MVSTSRSAFANSPPSAARLTLCRGAAISINFSIPRESRAADRRRINFTITAELNQRLGLNLTDAFCGFKAYRVCALQKLHVTELGYAMPLELWVQAAHRNLKIREVAVPLIYLDEKRSFGGALDDADRRLTHYREVIDKALAAMKFAPPVLPHVAMPCHQPAKSC